MDALGQLCEYRWRIMIRVAWSRRKFHNREMHVEDGRNCHRVDQAMGPLRMLGESLEPQQPTAGPG